MKQARSAPLHVAWRVCVASMLAVPWAILSPRTTSAQETALAAPQQPVAKIVASVDGDPITQRDVEAFASALGRPVSSNPNDESYKAALKGIITQKMLESEVNQYTDRVEESHVDRYIEELRKDKNLTDGQLRAEVQRSGMSYDEFRRHARLELEKMMMLDQEVRQKVAVAPEDIKAYYESHPDEFTVKQERYRIAQVLVALPADAKSETVTTAKAKAEAVRERASSGGDFADLARRFSDDASKSNGGDLGWFKPDEILEEIMVAVKPLKPGEVSPVVQTKHGFHVLKLVGHEMPGVRPLEDVTGEVRNKLIDAAAQQRYQTWVEQELIKHHYVETLD
ncbi:MAG: peptidylprolyl isomerase [Candidatus Binataceae bacterium]